MAIVKPEEVIDRWSVLIENAKGQAEAVFRYTQRLLEKSKVPNVSVKRRSIAPGVVRGFWVQRGSSSSSPKRRTPG